MNDYLFICDNCGQPWGSNEYPDELHYCSGDSAPLYTNRLLYTLLQEIQALRKDLAEAAYALGLLKKKDDPKDPEAACEHDLPR